MSIAFVQSKSNITGSSQAFSSINTAGNCIIVVVGKGTSAVGAAPSWTVSDTQGNTYNSLTIRGSTGASSKTWAQLFYAFGIKAGANTVSVAGGVFTDIAIHEFSGVDTLDQNASAGSSGNSQGSTSVTTTQANELLFGYTQGNANTNQTSITKETGWTLDETSATWFLTQHNIVSSTGTFDSETTTTVSSGTNICVSGIATFFTGSATVSLTGVSATSAVGTSSPTGDGNSSASGVGLTASVGTPTGTGTASVSITGVAATSAHGTVTALGITNVFPAGLQITSHVGTVEIQATFDELQFSSFTITSRRLIASSVLSSNSLLATHVSAVNDLNVNSFTVATG